jgi:probable HAF family extracellular repeat protein
MNCLKLLGHITGMLSTFRAVVVVSIALLGTTARAQTFTGLGALNQQSFWSMAHGVSADGRVVVGVSDINALGQSEAFRWTASTGMVGLGHFPGFIGSSAAAVSADGSVIVGGATQTSSGGDKPFRWTQATGLAGLGDLHPGGDEWGRAVGVSADGATVVGFSTSSSTQQNQAFRWTSSEGLVGLGDLPGGNVNSFANGVSADGSVIVGEGFSASGSEAFRWTSASGLVGLGDLPGGAFGSSATAVSADGQTVVGVSTSASGLEAFLWTTSGGMVGLGDLPGGIFRSIGQAVSADGSIVVGHGTIGNQQFVNEAFIWDGSNGMRHLKTVLSTEYGLAAILQGWTLREATGISADGRVIVGWGVNPSGRTEGWVFNAVPEPSSGLLLLVASSIFAWRTRFRQR